jgi:hypothetical protein
MRLQGGDIEVQSATGFRKGDPIPLVQITVSSNDNPDGKVTIWMSPRDARSIGLDLIGAAFACLSDAAMRTIAQKHGLDGDSLIHIQREFGRSALDVPDET